MREHFYTYPTVIELRPELIPMDVVRGRPGDRRSQPAIGDPLEPKDAQPQSRRSEPAE